MRPTGAWTSMMPGHSTARWARCLMFCHEADLKSHKGCIPSRLTAGRQPATLSCERKQALMSMEGISTQCPLQFRQSRRIWCRRV